VTGVRSTAALAALLVCAAPAVHAACSETNTVYLPVETGRDVLGLHGRTRAQYLDRRYGTGRWQAGDHDLVRLAASDAHDAPLRVTIAADEKRAVESADLIVEARVAYLDAANQRVTVYGHRELATYRLTASADNELSVPLSVFKEPGALLVAVHVVSAGTTVVQVQELPVEPDSCERHVYVEDRFMAIRLNQSEGRRSRGQ
jgi:hypothetical protein